MSESEMRSVLESSKLNKATKESLIQLGRKNGTKYEFLEKEISTFKNEYEKRIKELEISIQKTQKTNLEIYRKKTVDDSLEQKTNLLHKSLTNF